MSAAPLYVPTHPLIQHNLALLRHRDTQPPTFRMLVRELAQFLFYEAMKDVRLSEIDVPTPLVVSKGQEIADKVGLIPVLRAGLGMADARCGKPGGPNAGSPARAA